MLTVKVIKSDDGVERVLSEEDWDTLIDCFNFTVDMLEEDVSFWARFGGEKERQEVESHLKAVTTMADNLGLHKQEDKGG